MQSTINAHYIVIATHYNVLDCHYGITDSAMTDQIIEKVAGDVVDVSEESNTAQSHSDSENLFQRRYEVEYHIVQLCGRENLENFVNHCHLPIL